MDWNSHISYLNEAALFKTLMQILAILGIIAILSVIVHKGFADISVLAGRHSGADFWVALARYLLRNLAGG